MLYKEIHRGVQYLELTYYVFPVNFLIFILLYLCTPLLRQERLNHKKIKPRYLYIGCHTGRVKMQKDKRLLKDLPLHIRRQVLSCIVICAFLL